MEVHPLSRVKVEVHLLQRVIQSGRIGLPEPGMQLPYRLHPLAVAFHGSDCRLLLLVLQVKRLQVNQVGRQIVLESAVVIPVAAEKNRAESILRKAPDDLVHPAGHAAAHVGEGPLQKQHDVHPVRFRKIVVHNSYPIQNWATGPIPGL